MDYDNKQELIDMGCLNKDGIADKLIGYSPDHIKCKCCNRNRVEVYESGMMVCEKCNWDQVNNEFVTDYYYKN